MHYKKKKQTFVEHNLDERYDKNVEHNLDERYDKNVEHNLDERYDTNVEHNKCSNINQIQIFKYKSMNDLLTLRMPHNETKLG